MSHNPRTTVQYSNTNNQRVAKLVDGTITEKYLWASSFGGLANPPYILAVYDKDDTLIQRYEYADQRMPLSMTTNDNTKYYLHYDQVGSLRAVSDTNQNIIKEITYDTFGNILSDSNPDLKVPFGFAGGLYDTDTKLTRFGYRDYDAYTGKWTAKDPIGFAGGDSNLYGYVLGDPVGFVDPSGEFGIVGGIIGGVLEIGSQLLLNGGRWECIDWWDVGGMALVGAVAPGGLAAGKTIYSSGKAIQTLGTQSSRTKNRLNKLQNRINKHKNRIKNELITQGTIAGGKFAYKKMNGDNCSEECK